MLDQFLHSNINTRRDSYGGSPEARCKFPLQLIAAVTTAIGSSNVGVRIEPAGLYNGTFGDERVQTWSYLCEQLAAAYSAQDGSVDRLSYVHFIEPRMDRVEQYGERFWNGWSLPKVSNKPFRDILRRSGIPCITCGGWEASTAVSAVSDAGDGSAEGWDAVAFARWFVSNPDLPERIRLGKPLGEYDRSRFYGSWDGIREKGYVDYPTWEEAQGKPALKSVS